MPNFERLPSAEHRILPIGSDSVSMMNYLIGQSSPDKVTASWDEPAALVRDAVVHNVGNELHSFYLRGSVPRGAAIEGISDIDSIVVTKDDPKSIDRAWREDLEAEICQIIRCSCRVICYTRLCKIMHLSDAYPTEIRTLLSE